MMVDVVVAEAEAVDGKVAVAVAVVMVSYVGGGRSGESETNINPRCVSMCTHDGPYMDKRSCAAVAVKERGGRRHRKQEGEKVKGNGQNVGKWIRQRKTEGKSVFQCGTDR